MSNRIKIKRPLSHQIVIAIYFLAPVLNVIFLSLLYKKTILGIIINMFHYYGLVTTIWLITAPLVAISLYFVHRISWYIFLGHAAFLIIGGIVITFINPLIYNLMMLFGNLALVVIVGFIVQRNFRAPYFQALPRSWREKKRLPIEHVINLNGKQCKVSDLSETGCFVAGKEQKFEIGEGVYVHFNSESLEIKAGGEVARETEDGYGIRFVALTSKAKKDIKRMIKNRYALRYAINLDATWVSEGKETPGTVINISKTGFFIEMDIDSIEIGNKGDLNLTFNEQKFSLPAEIVWVNKESGDYGKPVGAGVRFKSKNHLLTSIKQKFVNLLQVR
jgi:hypothetical protein